MDECCIFWTRRPTAASPSAVVIPRVVQITPIQLGISENKQSIESKPLKLACGNSIISKMSAVMPQGIQKRKKSRVLKKKIFKKSKKSEAIKEEEMMDVGEGSTSQQRVKQPSDKKDEKGFEGVIEEENVEMKQAGKEKEGIQNEENELKEKEQAAKANYEIQKLEKPVGEEPSAIMDEIALPKNPIIKPSSEDQMVGVYKDVPEDSPNLLFGRCADTVGDFTNELTDQVPLKNEKTGEIKGVDAEGNRRVDTEKGEEEPKDCPGGV